VVVNNISTIANDDVSPRPTWDAFEMT